MLLNALWLPSAAGGEKNRVIGIKLKETDEDFSSYFFFVLSARCIVGLWRVSGARAQQVMNTANRLCAYFAEQSKKKWFVSTRGKCNFMRFLHSRCMFV